MKNSTRIFLALLSFITVLSGIPSARGQETETPFDSSGRIATITPEMESKVHLFPDSIGFQEARLFELPDSSYVLDITSEHNGKTMHTRKPMTRDSLKVLDAELENGLLNTDPALLQDQSGRADFLLGMASLSLVLYGPSVAILTASGSDGGTAAGVWLLAAGAGYLIPSAMTSNATVTPAQAKLGISAGYQGFAAGAVLADLTNTTSSSGVAGLALLTSIADLSTMYAIAGTSGMSEGTASLIANGGVGGMFDGYALGGLLDNSSDFSSGKEGGILLGHVAGYLAGSAIANGAKYTAGDATGINLLSSIGYLAGFLNVGAANTNTSLLRNQSAFAAALAGNITGYYIGTKVMCNYVLTDAQGTYLDLGTVGGALVGFGIGFIADPQFQTPLVPSLLATAGAIGGFAIVLSTMHPAPLTSDNSGFNVSVNPAGLLGALDPSMKSNNSILNLYYEW